MSAETSSAPRSDNSIFKNFDSIDMESSFASTLASTPLAFIISSIFPLTLTRNPSPFKAAAIVAGTPASPLLPSVPFRVIRPLSGSSCPTSVLSEERVSSSISKSAFTPFSFRRSSIVPSILACRCLSSRLIEDFAKRKRPSRDVNTADTFKGPVSGKSVCA